MNFYSYTVSKESGELTFNENFRMNNFSIEFFVDEDDYNSPWGHVVFKPASRVAELIYYGDSEDLMPMCIEYDLHDYEASCGDGVLIAFEEYDLSHLYRAAERFAHKILVNLLKEMEEA